MTIHVAHSHVIVTKGVLALIYMLILRVTGNSWYDCCGTTGESLDFRRICRRAWNPREKPVGCSGSYVMYVP